MKILLTTLNSKYIHSNLALKYLYGACIDEGYSPELIEFTINNSDDYIYGEMLREEYDLICFSCYIWNIERTLYLAENLKKASPETTVLLGGPEVTWRGVEIMKKNSGIDFLLAGEGEENFPKFLRSLSEHNGNAGSNFREIDGLHYRSVGKIYVNPSAGPVNFEDVSFPFANLVSEPNKIMYYESVRGCPFSCSYCVSSIERGVRPLPIGRVKEDLSYFIYKGVKQVKFVDRTFNYDNIRAMEIIRYLMDADNGITNFHFEICGDIIGNDMLRLLSNARPGLFQFEIGVQSTNEQTLKAINRRCDFNLLTKNVTSLLQMGNIHLHLDLIAGLPYEDYSGFADSFNSVYQLKPHMLQLGFLKLLPGTPIREEIEKYSYVYRRNAPYEVISNKFLAAKDLVKLKMVEKVFNLYYNRGGFEKTLDYLAYNIHPSPFAFYEDFSNFYFEKGFQHVSHNKENLYRVLSYYGRSLDGSDPENIELLLEQDMEKALNSEAIRKFMKTGWKLQNEK